MEGSKMRNTIFNTTALAAVFIWINTTNGKTYISTNAKTDYDDGHYDDWIYNRLIKYERQIHIIKINRGSNSC